MIFINKKIGKMNKLADMSFICCYFWGCYLSRGDIFPVVLCYTDLFSGLSRESHGHAFREGDFI